MLTESADDINRWSHEHAVTGVGVREISCSARQLSHVRDPQTVTYISDDFSQDILIILNFL